jgi:phosphopantothenoylcysteine decarboxylase/phosphopantothenate--cysteine ligase
VSANGRERSTPARRRRPAVRPLRPLRIVVTAGPTRERIDPVRYLSNDSSGRMGFAIAAEAARRGHKVALVSGPVSLATPPGVRRIDVESARDMLAAVTRAFRGADALFMAAAVADWRPARRLAGKWRAKDGGAARAKIELVRNPDVLATVARGKGPRLVVGFALETASGERRARAKLAKKRLDYIVLNDASALNATSSSATVLGADGTRNVLQRKQKQQLARVLVDLAEAWPRA